MTIILLLLFTIPLVAIGIFASYTDIKEGIIPNKLILPGFLWGLFLYSFLFLYNTFFLQSEALFEYLFSAFFNGVIAILAGYLIWKLTFWSAGDGKLFALYGFLLPLEFYSEFYINYFPAFALLVNFAIPLILLISFKALVAALRKRQKIKEVLVKREFLKPHNLRKHGRTIFVFVTDITMAMIVIRLLVMLFERLLLLPPNGFVIFLLLVTLMYGFRKLKIKFPTLEVVKYFIILTFFGNLLAQGDFQSIFDFIRMIIVFALIVGLLRAVLLFYVRSEETEVVKAKEVKQGMFLTKEWKEYLSQKISKLTKNDKHEHFSEVTGGGLTKRQAEIIRELFRDDEKYKVQIYNTLPFAPFILLAAGISIVTHTSFAPFLMRFFNMFIHF